MRSDQLILTKMEYAMKSLSLLSPKSLSKCVSVSVTMTQQFLSRPTSKPRPYRVCNFDRSVHKGIVAESLEDLLNKTQEALLMAFFPLFWRKMGQVWTRRTSSSHWTLELSSWLSSKGRHGNLPRTRAIIFLCPASHRRRSMWLGSVLISIRTIRRISLGASM